MDCALVYCIKQVCTRAHILTDESQASTRRQEHFDPINGNFTVSLPTYITTSKPRPINSIFSEKSTAHEIFSAMYADSEKRKNSVVNNYQLQSNNLITDKRLLELRAVALEYVKQIVAKASELSQERQKIKDAQKLTNYYNGTTTNCCKTNTTYLKSTTAAPPQTTATTTATTTTTASTKRMPESIDPAIQRAIIREAASNINKRFHLVDNPQQQQQYPPVNSIEKRTNDKTGAFLLCNRAKDNASDTNRLTDPNLASSDHLRYQPDTDAAAQWRSGNLGPAAASSQSKRINAGGSTGARRRRGLHHRLNWHLLVSCFSTCLPHSLVEAASRSANAASGQPMDGSTGTQPTGV